MPRADIHTKQGTCIKINTGKQMFFKKAIGLRHDIPLYLKHLSTFSFAKRVKQYLQYLAS